MGQSCYFARNRFLVSNDVWIQRQKNNISISSSHQATWQPSTPFVWISFFNFRNLCTLAIISLCCKIIYDCIILGLTMIQSKSGRSRNWELQSLDAKKLLRWYTWTYVSYPMVSFLPRGSFSFPFNNKWGG